MASAAARAAVSRGWLRSTRLPVRVISVGNIQAGGAGKTPLVARIAQEAHERGLRACILCRGYGGEWERSGGGIILPAAAYRDEGGAAPPASACGDEAALLHELAPHAVIGVGADRVRQFELTRARVGLPDLVILDDGFQHWRIRQDLRIVAVTSHDSGEVPFRDRPSALRYADLIVWTKGEHRPPVPRGCEDKPWAKIRYRLKPPAEGSYWLVTGVADAQDALRLARASGYRIERHVYFKDHARYARPMVLELLRQATAASARVAVTGKDWVKWRELEGVRALEGSRITVLEPELVWEEGGTSWNRLLWGS